MTRRVLDVANYQGVPNFAALKAADPDLWGVIIKATEGNWKFTNPEMDAQIAAARAAGLLVGFYTFWHPSVAGRGDMQLFMDRIAGYSPELGVWLDAEVNDGVDPYTICNEMLDDLAFLRDRFPFKTGVYSADWWMSPNVIGVRKNELLGYALWVAGYTATLPYLPPPWTQAILWQYTDAQYGQNLDASVFLGTDAQAAWLESGKTPHIDPTPLPLPGGIMAVVAEMPNITASDHTHPGYLAEFKTLCRMIDPAATKKLKSDKDWLTYTEQLRAFFKVTSDAKGRIGTGMWGLVVYLAGHAKAGH